MVELINPARERLKKGEVALGVGLRQARTVDVAPAMKTAGFSIATGLLFAAAARGFGRGPLWMTIPIGIVFSFLVWLVFAKGLQLTLPAGPLEKLF